MREMKKYKTRDITASLKPYRVSLNIMLTDLDKYKKSYTNPYYVDLDNQTKVILNGDEKWEDIYCDKNQELFVHKTGVKVCVNKYPDCPLGSCGKPDGIGGICSEDSHVQEIKKNV